MASIRSPNGGSQETRSPGTSHADGPSRTPGDRTGEYCEDEVLEHVRGWALDLRCIATELGTIGPLWVDVAERLTRLTRDLEGLVAGLEGLSRYRVVVEHGTVYAVDETEAIARAERGKGPPDEVLVHVEEHPLDR